VHAQRLHAFLAFRNEHRHSEGRRAQLGQTAEHARDTLLITRPIVAHALIRQEALGLTRARRWRIVAHDEVHERAAGVMVAKAHRLVPAVAQRLWNQRMQHAPGRLV